MRRLTPLLVTLYLAAAVAFLLLVTAVAIAHRPVATLRARGVRRRERRANVGRVGLARLSAGLREVGT